MTGTKDVLPVENYALSRSNDLSPDSIVPASCHGCCHKALYVQSGERSKLTTFHGFDLLCN